MVCFFYVSKIEFFYMNPVHKSWTSYIKNFFLKKKNQDSHEQILIDALFGEPDFSEKWIQPRYLGGGGKKDYFLKK